MAAGVSTCTRRPSRITATRSASDSASSWSWVMSSVAMPCSRWMRRISSRIATRVAASSADSGSSSSSAAGSNTSARASATRCCWPPESAVGQPVGVGREADELQHPPGLRRPAPPRRGRARAADRRRCRARSCAGTAHRTGRRCRIGASGRRHRSRRVRPARCGRDCARTNPAISRRSVVLPQPEGPMQTSISPGWIARSTSATPAWLPG